MTQLTDQQLLFLDLLYSDGLPRDLIVKATEVKGAAGYSENTNAYTILRSLTEAIIERNKEFMILDSSESIKALHDVVRTPTTPGNDTRIKAANSLLDRAGFGKKENETVELKLDKGIVILPAKRD